METNVQLRNITLHTQKITLKKSMDTNLLAKKHYIAKSQGILSCDEEMILVYIG